MLIKAFVCGSSGTTGLELLSRLEKTDGVEPVLLPETVRHDENAAGEAMRNCDVTFLCLPDDAALRMAELAPEDKLVIDSSTAHRVAAGWVYGFPELSHAQKTELIGARRIANPGCHATGFISLVAPLVAAGTIKSDTRLSCYSLTGYSGGGKKMIAEYEAQARPRELDSPRHYSLGLSHKHLPEMKKYGGLDVAPLFEPIVCDFYRGMAVTVPLFSDELGGAGVGDLIELYRAYYAGCSLIEVSAAPAGGYIAANELAGTDRLKIYVRGGGDMISLTAVFDNLGKGAAGAAIQNMWLALGLGDDGFIN